MTVPASAGSEGGGSSEMSKAGVFRSSVWLERRTGEQVGTVECGEYWSQGCMDSEGADRRVLGKTHGTGSDCLVL